MAMATKRKLPITKANNARLIASKSRIAEKQNAANAILSTIDPVDKAFVNAYENDAKAFVKPELIEVDGQVFINPETNIKFSDQINVGTGSRSLMFNFRGLDFRASFVMPKSAYFMASVLTK